MRFISIFVFLLLLFFIRKNAVAPEMTVDRVQVLLALAAFLFFFRSTLSWGSWIYHKIMRDQANAQGFGRAQESVWMSAFFGLALAGSIGIFVLPISPKVALGASLFWVIVPLLFNWNRVQFRFESEGLLSWLGKTLLWVLILTRFQQGLLVSQHGDPFLYDVAGPIHQILNGSFQTDLMRPFHATTGFFHALFGFGAALFMPSKDHGMVLVVHFAQFCSAGFGLFFCLIAAQALMLQLRVQRKFIPWLLIWIASVPELAWSASTAKADWGAAFLGLAALSFLFQSFERKQNGILFCLGLASGLAFTAKFSLAYFIASLWIIGFFRICLDQGVKTAFEKVSAVFSGFLLASAPILVRNAISVQNPIYPAFTGIFSQTWISADYLNAVHSTQTNPDLWGKGLEYFFKVATVHGNLFPILLGLFLLFSVRDRAVGLVTGIWFLGTVFMSIHVGHSAFVRWANLLLFLYYFSIAKGLNNLPIVLREGAGLLIIVFTFMKMDLPVYTWLQYFSPKFDSGVSAFLTKFNGNAKIWILKNVPEGATVVAFGDNELMTLQRYRVVCADEVPERVLSDLVTESAQKEIYVLWYRERSKSAAEKFMFTDHHQSIEIYSDSMASVYRIKQRNI